MVAHSQTMSLPETKATDDTSRADTQQSQSKRENVFIISGPGIGGWRAPQHAVDKAYGDAFRSRGANVGTFGNGHDAQSLESLGEAFERFMVNPEEDATIFLVAHGQTKDGMHHLVFEDEDKANTPTWSLLSAICPTPQGCGKRDIFFGACGSRSALGQIIDLPKGSQGVSLAADDQSIILETSFPDAIRNSTNSLTADGLLDTYLIDVKKTIWSVASYITGTGMKDYSDTMAHKFDAYFTSNEKLAVHKRLGPELGIKRCDEIMSQITSAQSMEDLRACDMGHCLAVEKAASEYWKFL